MRTSRNFDELGWTGVDQWGGAVVTITAITIAAVAVLDVVDGFRKASTALQDPEGRARIKAAATSFATAVETTVTELSSEVGEPGSRKATTPKDEPRDQE